MTGVQTCALPISEEYPEEVADDVEAGFWFEQGAISGMVVGAATVLFWIYAPITIDGQALSAIIYEIVPGFIFLKIAIVVVSLTTAEPKKEITDLFDEVESSL